MEAGGVVGRLASERQGLLLTSLLWLSLLCPSAPVKTARWERFRVRLGKVQRAKKEAMVETASWVAACLMLLACRRAMQCASTACERVGVRVSVCVCVCGVERRLRLESAPDLLPAPSRCL